MPYSLKTASQTISTSPVDLYTCGGDNAVVIGLSLSNNLAADVEVTAQLYSDSGGTSIDIIAPNTVLAEGESIVPIGGAQKVVMSNSDIIKITCDTSNGIDAVLSAMELTDYTL